MFYGGRKMTLPPKFGDLYTWAVISEKPDEYGCYISGVKDNAPDEIKSLFKEYMAIIHNRD